MIQIDDSVFILVDVQGKLAEVMHEKAQLHRNLEILVAGMRRLDVPILWMEQIPDKMGETLPALRTLLEPAAPLSKACFSCAGSDAFTTALDAAGRRTAIVAGIEAHVCVYQTTRDLLERGYHVEIVADAVSSRAASNVDHALRRMAAEGASLTTTEMVLFELMRTAEHPAFRDILKLVR
jgi:nicotinamidase-related amidase